MSKISRKFYLKLAVSNIRKNGKIYFPYIFTCIFTVMMLYVVSSIINNGNMHQIRSSENLVMLLNIALAVARIFAVIFLFYTNSFLMKRRKKELGLYNILGMEKRHIGRVMLYETLIIAVTSIATGLLAGILFSKLVFLFLLKLISFKVVLGFDIPVASVIFTVILFAGIFTLTLCYNLAKVRLAKPIELLHGGEIGEKEPKTKIIMTLIGLGCMGWGYWFALTVESPLAAFSMFFLAVALVVVGTYALFTAGSIAVLKLLRKNKKFYYKTKNFTSVSGMLYRMKQNAVGLANICILSTMVLIMFSTTASLYMGMEGALKKAQPSEIVLTYNVEKEDLTDEISKEIKSTIDSSGIKTSNFKSFHSLTIIAEKENSSFTIKNGYLSAYDPSGACVCAVMPVDEFNRINNTDYSLGKDEVLVYSKSALNGTLTFESDNVRKEFNIKGKLSSVDKMLSNGYESMLDSYIILVDDLDTLKELHTIIPTEGSRVSHISYYVAFDTDADKAASIKLSNTMYENMGETTDMDYPDNIYEMRDEYFGMYGGFLFIGLFLSILFLMATVLIIYYKQISEGYDDKERFQIMQKVGMSRAEVRKTIRSQVVTVFFLPIAATAVHIAVSFRIIEKMLLVLGLADRNLFIACTVGTMVVFCIVYGIVYLLTAKAYYKIVSFGEEN